jgi:hypothetical protein
MSCSYQGSAWCHPNTGWARSSCAAVFEVEILVPKTLQLAYVQISSKGRSLSTSPWRLLPAPTVTVTSTLTSILLPTSLQEIFAHPELFREESTVKYEDYHYSVSFSSSSKVKPSSSNKGRESYAYTGGKIFETCPVCRQSWLKFLVIFLSSSQRTVFYFSIEGRSAGLLRSE